MITTTTGKAVAALKALDEIRGQKIDKNVAKGLFILRNRLTESYQFWLEQIGATCEMLGVEMVDGKVHFGDDKEKSTQFIKEVSEIEATEAKVDCDPVDMTNEDVKISEEFVEATDGFIVL